LGDRVVLQVAEAKSQDLNILGNKQKRRPHADLDRPYRLSLDMDHESEKHGRLLTSENQADP
jgi:hypothetical protein